MVPAARGRGEVGRCGAARELVAKSSWVPHPQVSRTAPAREVEGAPPRIERVLALACGSERRTDRRPTPLAAVSAGRTAGTRGCILPPPLDLPPAAAECVEGTHSHTCAPDEGTPPRRGAGPAEWICTGKQPPHTRARRPTLGPPGLQLGSPTRARTQERPLGARRWRSPLFASGQYVADTCARGGGPFRPLVALSHMKDSARAVVGMAPVQLVGVCGTSVCLAPLPPFIDAPSLFFVIEPDLCI